MKQVKVNYTGIPHFFAKCSNCDWIYESHLNVKRGYREIRKHVRETGHMVHLEKMVWTCYVLEPIKPP